MPMIYAAVTIAAAGANIGAAVADFTRANFALGNSVRVGVPPSWLPMLGTLKLAGAVGLLLGLAGIRSIGVAAAIGLVLFFLGAVAVHLRAGEHRHIITTVGYLLLAAAALAASLTYGQ
jgi:hypothetical protein